MAEVDATRRAGPRCNEEASGLDVRTSIVKLFPGAARVSGRALSACAREVSLAARLDHPNIGRGLGVGRLDDGTPFIATERLRGETLKELLARRGRLGVAEARAVVVGVTAGLSAAHAAGLAHGTLHAENVFLVDGEVASIKLLNFGARHLSKRGRWPRARFARGAFCPLDDQRAVKLLARTMLSGAPGASEERVTKGRRAVMIAWMIAVSVAVGVSVLGGWLSELGPTMSRAAPALGHVR